MELERRKMFQAFEAARDAGPYDELPMLRSQADPQIYLSHNDRPQPFWLICSLDSMLSNAYGTGRVYMADSPVRYHNLEPGDLVYVPAGVPHRLVPDEPSVVLRYKAREAGWEGVAWYCEQCEAELYREEFDTSEEIPQAAYQRACDAFNADAGRRRCPRCGTEADPVDVADLRWSEIAEAIAADD